ncbi:MAG: hypothetical protein ACI9WC_001068 [Arenicella sp.]|jgi:hypothetical protein
MIEKNGFGFLHYGILVTVVLSGLLAYSMFSGDRQLFLPGKTTHGHHQIELKCDTCHVESFKAGKPMQEACLTCHSESMEQARDTHPKKKFTDPRNSGLLSNLNATECVTCHAEHSPEITGEHGVTLPEDFCFYCHRDIAKDRPSHEGFEFDSCSSSGCHNYHDNRALYEKFLQKNIEKPNILNTKKTLIANGVAAWKSKNKNIEALNAEQHDGANIDNYLPLFVDQWQGSAHAQSGVNCSGCHENQGHENQSYENQSHENQSYENQSHENQNRSTSSSSLTIEVCSECHSRHTEGFKQGLHGMKLTAGMGRLKVSEALLEMKSDALHRELNCGSCHAPHRPDLKLAAVTSCQGCHDDQHSNNYASSKHATLFEKELSGELAEGEGVSCASCHMPRKKKGKLVYVEHNQTLNLKPNSKMLRPVCMNCHGLEYATAALADKRLIARNFSVDFTEQHPSFNMVRARMEERRRAKKARAAQRDP